MNNELGSNPEAISKYTSSGEGEMDEVSRASALIVFTPIYSCKTPSSDSYLHSCHQYGVASLRQSQREVVASQK
jgi:hypothetical protein